MLNTDTIIALYDKYQSDLLQVKNGLRQFCDENWPKGYRPQMCDIELELIYMFIREIKPDNIVEFSPCHGYSTTWLLNALDKNDNGKLFSFDLIDNSKKYVPPNLQERWAFIQGDVKENLDKFPEQVDYLFIDSDHSAEFCRWYIENVFPLIRSEVYVNVHDIIKRNRAKSFKNGEADEIIEWLSQKQIPFYTAGLKDNIMDTPTIDNNANYIISEYREKNGLDGVIINDEIVMERFKRIPRQRNSMIFFKMK